MRLHLWAPAFTGFGGGIGSFSRAVAIAMRESGHQVHLFGKHDSTGTWNAFPLSGSGESQRAQTLRFAALCVGSCVRERPAHVVSAHVNFGPAAFLARKLAGTPYTVVAHGIDVHPRLPRATKLSLRRASSVLAVSDWTRQRVLALGVAAEKIRVLPNTFDETRFDVGARPQALIDRYRISPGEKVVLTVARLDSGERYKGYDRMIEALPAVRAACGKVRLVLAGGGDDVARVRALTRAVGVESAVTFAGFVPDDELPQHYRLADAFAMPSTGEGFGIVYLEAMGCGTPVLAGNRDGSTDAVGGGTLGALVDPDDVGAIAAGAISLLSGEGPPLWFDRIALRNEAIRRFGRAAFTERLGQILSALEPRG